jgi:hypothetical protein
LPEQPVLTADGRDRVLRGGSGGALQCGRAVPAALHRAHGRRQVPRRAPQQVDHSQRPVRRPRPARRQGKYFPKSNKGTINWHG